MAFIDMNQKNEVGAGHSNSDNGLSDEELVKRAATYPSLKLHFKGVFSKDTLPRIRDGDCAIVNIENSVDKKGNPLPGSHWVAVGRHKNQSWYMDSFGLPIPPLIERSVHSPIYHRLTEIQSVKSSLCGLFSLAACVCVYQTGEPVVQSLDSFYRLFERPNLDANDSVLTSYLSQCHRSVSDTSQIRKLY